MRLRNSRIELLRILTMFFIMISHSSEISIVNSFDLTQIYRYPLAYSVASLFTMGGMIGNCIFMMITGFYMYKVKLVSWSKNVKLLLELTVYYWILLIVYVLLGLNTVDNIILVKMFCPAWFGLSWYIGAYVIFSCFIPYINRLVDTLEKFELRSLVYLLVLFGFVLPTFFVNTFICSGIFMMFTSYMIGAYIGRYEIKNLKLMKISCATSLILTICSVLIICYIGYTFKNEKLFAQSLRFAEPMSLIFAASLFGLFSQMSPFSNKIIDKISCSVLGIYILHDNPVVGNSFWGNIIPPEMVLPYHLWFASNLMKVFLVFVTALIVDQLRLKLLDEVYMKISLSIVSFLEKKVERIRIN